MAYVEYGNEWIEYEQNFKKGKFNFNTRECVKEIESNLIQKVKSYRESLVKKKETKRKINKLIEENPDKIVTMQDSLDAGNCHVGTERFKEKYFPDRDLQENPVTVGELAKYKERTGVKQVLLEKYKELK